jgi:hypothetical protein
MIVIIVIIIIIIIIIIIKDIIYVPFALLLFSWATNCLLK